MVGDAVTIHPTHDMPPDAATWRCLRCGCGPGSIDSGFPCKPPLICGDDPQADAEDGWSRDAEPEEYTLGPV